MLPMWRSSPAGLDLGAVEPAEIALSIMAEIVQVHRSMTVRAATPDAVTPDAPDTATDPVCGMTVEIATARYTTDHQGQRFFFCCAGCKSSFDQEPARYQADR